MLSKSNLILALGVVLLIVGIYKASTEAQQVTVTQPVLETTTRQKSGLPTLLILAGVAIIGAKFFKLY